MFDESKYLTEEELTKERTTEDFCNWVDTKLADWAVLKRSNPDGRELHERILLRRGLFRPFHEEAYVFCRYLQATNQISNTVHCVIPNDSHLHYDAFLKQHRSCTRFEITQGIEDDHHIRMEQLLEHGTVNALSEITATGTKRTGRNVHIPDEMVCHDGVVRSTQGFILDRVRRKTEGQTVNQRYHPSTKLLVGVDDYNLDPEDYDVIRAGLSDTLVTRQKNFASVIVIGFAGRLLLDFPRSAHSSEPGPAKWNTRYDPRQ